jgi:sialic acid synthase SpsE
MQIVPMMAVAAGAKVIEKHFTIDKTMSISNHFFAADEPQLRDFVYYIRQAEKMIGGISLVPVYEEVIPYRSATRSWTMAKDIKKGEEFTEDHIAFLRPGTGLEYLYRGTILMSKATDDIEKGAMIRVRDLDYEDTATDNT